MKKENENQRFRIAFNGFRGGNKGSVTSQPLSEYDKTIRYPWVHDAVLQIRGEKPIRSVNNHDAAALAKAQQRIKSQLPFRSAHYYQFKDNKRRQANIIPESFLFQTTIDVDEKELVEKALERAKLLDSLDFIPDDTGVRGASTAAVGNHDGDEAVTADQKTENGQKNPWKGMLLHLEYSARMKLHIDIRMPIGMTIEETQRAYCQALGVPCDESCFSPERIIFMTDADSEIYRSSDWYALLPEDEINLRREAFRKRGLDIDGRASENTSQNQKHSNSENYDNQPLLSGDKTGEKQPAVGGAQVPPHPASHPADSHTSTGVGSAPAHPDGSHHGNDKNLIAFDLFWAQAGLAEVDINAVGSRHSSLLAIMSAGASRMMGEEELRRVVEQRMPAFAQERDC